MKKAILVIFTFFYTLGSFCLPLGDFSALQDLPEMYRHCKATEDVDMSPLDFITDHLVNIDGMFDNHEDGDEQKPHHPVQTQHYGESQNLLVAFFTCTIRPLHLPASNVSFPPVSILPSDYNAKIFRPPVV